MRAITRKSVRRVGDYVVTITPEGLSLRKFRSKAETSAKSLTWDTLIEMAGAGAAQDREAAFSRPCPRGWVPVGGERVWVSRDISHRAQGTVTATLNVVPEVCFRVDFPRGESVIARLNQLRPAPPTKEVVEDRPMLVE